MSHIPANIRQALRWRSGGSSSGASDHGALSGLSDDDHAQYHTDARGDARYAALGHSHSYAASSHNHAISEVTGLQSALDGKAATSHGHAISDTTGLQTALDGKAASAHSHSYEASGAVAAHEAAADPHPGYLTAAEGDAAYSHLPQVFTLGSDVPTAANTTPVTLTGLVFDYAANSKYRVWFMGRVSPAAATTGCGFQFDVSSAVTAIDVLFFHQLANTGTLSGGHSIADDASVGVSSGLPGTSNYPVTGHGLLVTGANSGTAQLRFRSETSAVITARAGLTLVVEKIA